MVHHVARWIFHDTVTASVEYYNATPELNERPLSYWTDTLIYELNGKRQVEPLSVTTVPPSQDALTWWARVHLAQWMLRHHETHINYDGFTRLKVQRFIDAHLSGIYEPLGVSLYPDDMSHCRRVVVARIPLLDSQRMPYNINALARDIRRDPAHYLKILREDVEYEPLSLQDEQAVHAHSLYAACCITLAACTDRTLQLAFVDTFYYIFGYHRWEDSYLMHETGRAAWHQYYPLETRAFTCDDLPNFFHVLWHIPLYGEVDAGDYPLMRIMLKCMPFACQRRQLLEQIEALCTINPKTGYCKNEGFWRVFSKIMWCCLTGAGYVENEPYSMHKWLRMKQLCENRTLLINALTRSDAMRVAASNEERKRLKKEKEDNCLIIFTAFRLYIIHMVSRNPHYAEVAGLAIPWDDFVAETNMMAQLIRSSNTLAEDVFGDARILLARANKQEKRHVFRFRKLSCMATLLAEANDVQDKEINRGAPHFLEEIRTLQRMMEYPNDGPVTPLLDMVRAHSALYDYFDVSQRSVAVIKEEARSVMAFWIRLYNAVDTPLSNEVKERILKLLLRVTRYERTQPLTMSILRDPRYGGVEMDTVCALLELIDMYNDNALPKALRQRFLTINIADVRVVAWYCSVCAVLEKISFAPLDYDTVRAIDHAMVTVRHPLYPGQQLNPAMYNVLYTLCCENLVTMMGRHCFGHKKVAYDVRKQLIVCNRNNSNVTTKKVEEGLDDVLEPVEARTAFHTITCNNQPVLTIPLRAYALIIGGKLKMKTRYMRCPRCACLHVYDPMRYHAGTYCCARCARDDLTRPESGAVTMVYQCAFCLAGGNTGHLQGQTSRPRVKPDNVLLIMTHSTHSGVLDPDDAFQYMRFCHRCYSIAKRYYHVLPHELLWKKIQSKITENARRVARGIYTKK